MITRHKLIAIKISNPELPNVNILATEIQDPIIGSEITQINSHRYIQYVLMKMFFYYTFFSS